MLKVLSGRHVVAILAFWVGARDLVEVAVDFMHHQNGKDGLGASDYLSVNRGNQWILAIFLHC
jgi:hypothetical protein